MKKALITGITGQDGAYLAELLLAKEYEVHGIIRRASTFNTQRVDHLYQDPHRGDTHLLLHYGDLSDAGQITNILYNIRPDEIYHLGAQSHVRVSFDIPEYTGDVTGMGTTRVLEALRRSGIPAQVLPGIQQRDVRLGSCASVGEHAVSAAKPLCRGEGLRLLDDGQLSGGVRDVRQQRHPLQP